ncbi:Fur family transcriptional regulator [Vaginisenegalia massiliensis]|uniref:Fur family transcriptional regulator n=1 Tax=Vaginisenegalia massiliensis TaxID=2058294 RepID=UPI000F52C854|nr:Fur family transcriptional regulator [Vaginisenegalia massiliensis]
MSESHSHSCHHHGNHPTIEQRSTEEIVQDALKTIKSSGYKSTKKREEILQIFAENQRYLSAKYIHSQLSQKYPTMSYNTTYRNLYDFVDMGILEYTEYNQEQMFRITCWDCDHHHHHFICTSCGKTIPLDCCPIDHVDTDLSNVKIESHRFEVFGKCQNCLED